MARKLRYVPEGGSLVEITNRTIQSRPLLKPSRPFNEVLVGILARAKRRYGLKICAVPCMSNHLHLLAWVRDAPQMSAFMGYVNTNLSKEVGRLYEWRHCLWHGRFHDALVSDEEEAQIKRLRYLLSNSVKEHLVAKVKDWPGVHSGEALSRGKCLRGYWFDRSKEFVARQRGEAFPRLRYATEESLELDPLPCWAHLEPAEIQRRVRELIASVETEAAAERLQQGREPLGAEKVKARHPHAVPNRTKRSPAPRFHAVTRRAWQELRAGYAWFEAAYREAARRLRAGDLMVRFPVGAFLPPLPVGVVTGA